MSAPLRVLAVVGSLHAGSVTRAVVAHLADRLRAAGCEVDMLDLRAEPLPLLDTDTSFQSPAYAQLKPRVARADAFLLGTPDYHGSVSGALKNFLDHFWREFAGKLFASVVASHEKGLTVHDQLRTIARQCYAWSLPYGVSFVEKEDVRDSQVTGEAFQQRLEMFARDLRVYGALLTKQRHADLTGTEPGFLARHRK